MAILSILCLCETRLRFRVTGLPKIGRFCSNEQCFQKTVNNSFLYPAVKFYSCPICVVYEDIFSKTWYITDILQCLYHINVGIHDVLSVGSVFRSLLRSEIKMFSSLSSNGIVCVRQYIHCTHSGIVLMFHFGFLGAW